MTYTKISLDKIRTVLSAKGITERESSANSITETVRHTALSRASLERIFV